VDSGCNARECLSLGDGACIRRMGHVIVGS